MMTLILMAVCSAIGALLGQYVFDDQMILGAVIGAIIGLLLRFGAAGEMADCAIDCLD